MFFFFKQKTAYEMRISDWSSDVCSSDLLPSSGWLRRYRVRAHGRVTAERLAALAKGVTVEGVDYGPVEATLDHQTGSNAWLTIGLREGKNREVRRICAHLGLTVNRLIRDRKSTRLNSSH